MEEINNHKYTPTKKRLLIAAAILIFFISLWFIIMVPVSWLQKPGEIPADIGYIQSVEDSLYAGYAYAPLILGHQQSLAGYGNRGNYRYVLDTPYVHVLVLEVGKQKAAIISTDLLIFPPLLYEHLQKEKGNLGFKKGSFYVSASHSHHSLGGWASGLAGIFLAGQFNPGGMDQWVQITLNTLKEADSKLQKAAWAHSNITADQFIRNRLEENGTTLNILKGLHFRFADSAQISVSSYSAHATSLDGDSLYLSNDYPAFLRDSLLRDNDIMGAFFIAGAMGSQSPQLPYEKSIASAKAVGYSLAGIQLKNLHNLQWKHTACIGYATVELPLPAPAPRILKRWAVRPWLFKALLSESSAPLHILSVDEQVFLSLPMDFSAEIAAEIMENTRSVPVEPWFNSFSGGYRGYIVHNKHWNNSKKSEAREMNWSGPEAASYLQTYLEGVILEISGKQDSN